MKPLTAIALSGGIDSSTAALLLKDQGHDLLGLHFLTGYETEPPDGNAPGENARQVAARLGIPFEMVDLGPVFQTRVIAYFMETYRAGHTPNPCLVCNPAVKFGALFERARRLGADRLATGHYARLTRADGIPLLLKGLDPAKDQSYFLARLSRTQLEGAIFPLGTMTKHEVKTLASARGLPSPAGKESQDVCFVRTKHYADFFARQPGFSAAPGLIEDLDGRILGRHNGLYLFTVGQRRGINCPAAKPYYVVRLDTARNRLVVGAKEDLLAAACQVTGINWIIDPPPGPLSVQVRLRYRHRAVDAVLQRAGETDAELLFATPQAAVTPGQGAVFYAGDTVLGGGWIVSGASPARKSGSDRSSCLFL